MSVYIPIPYLFLCACFSVHSSLFYQNTGGNIFKIWKKKGGGVGVKLSEAKVEGRIEEGRGSISVHIWE